MSVYLASITFPVDPEEFFGVEDNPESVKTLVLAMIAGQADFPDMRDGKLKIEIA